MKDTRNVGKKENKDNDAQNVQDFALQAPDADVQQQPNAAQQGAQALQPPDPNVINPGAGQQEVQNQIQAAPVGDPAVGAGAQQQKDAVANNMDNNNNGADVADIPVHRGVKEDPANAIENGESHQGEENQADPNQDAAANADVGAL